MPENLSKNSSNISSGNIYLAVPKGRILEELSPLMQEANIIPEAAFFDDSSRKLKFDTNINNLKLIRVRSFDVASFVAYGGAHIGVAGSDVLAEFNFKGIYAPLDLNIGKCRLSLAAPEEFARDNSFWNSSHIRVATKYPNITHDFFAKRGVQAECIKLNGAIELAPLVGLCRRMVDLVSTGSTLKANGLCEVETIMEVSSRLIVNRVAYKTRMSEIQPIIEVLKQSAEGRKKAA